MERSYVRLLRETFGKAQKIVEEGLDPLLENWDEELQRTDRDAPTPRRINRRTIKASFRWIESSLRDLLGDDMRPSLARIASGVSRHTARDLSRVLGETVPREIEGLDRRTGKWIRNNVKLIRSGILGDRRSLLRDMQQTIGELYRRRAPRSTVSSAIARRIEVSRSRANLIATDQVLKLNGELVRARQENVEISRYRWVTMRDDQVRPAHMELDGSIHSWSSPPSEGHPGDAVNCRCVAEPVGEPKIPARSSRRRSANA